MIYEEIVEKLLEANDINTAPIDIIKICSNLGISVYKKPMENSISGYIIVKKEKIERADSNKIICVNSFHSLVRQVFTIAHEIAHYLLHKPLDAEYFAHRDDKLTGDIYNEREANNFASHLLMPEKLLNKCVLQYKYDNPFVTNASLIDHVSLEFGVSYDAARVRLTKKGVI